MSDIFSRGTDPMYAHNAGYMSGKSIGYVRGLDVGREQGYNSGFNAGQQAGQSKGYNNGWNARQAEINELVVDVNHGMAFFEWKVRTLMEALHAVAPMVAPKLSAESQERFAFALSVMPREKDNSGTGPAYQAFLHSAEYRAFFEQHRKYFEQIQQAKAEAARAQAAAAAKAARLKKLQRVVRILLLLGIIAVLVKKFLL